MTTEKVRTLRIYCHVIEWFIELLQIRDYE
jgi:hypothetical protein